jgi:hypothetical protein
MWPVAIVPGEVERQLLLESGEAVRNQDQPSRALGFERSHASLDHRQAPILPQSTESMLNTPPPAPPPECLGGELNASVRNDVPGLLACFPKSSL